MRNTTLIGRGIMITLLFLLLLQAVSAIGITPSGRLFEYESGAQHTFNLSVLGTQNMTVHTGGELADALTLDVTGATITATLTIPELEPGYHEGTITALEQLPENSGQIGAATAVTSTIRIRVPYPGLYAQAALLPIHSGPEEDTIITVSITNEGGEDIREASGLIDLFDHEDYLTTISTPILPIQSGENIKTQATWQGAKPAGVYQAQGTITYDGMTTTAASLFRVGEPSVTISLLPTSAKAGETIPLDIEITSVWNEDFEAYAQVSLLQDGRVVSTSITQTQLLKAFQSIKLQAYLATTLLEDGQYEMLITAYHLDTTSTERVSVLIKDSTIYAGTEPSTRWLLICTLITLLITLLTLTYYKTRGRL